MPPPPTVSLVGHRLCPSEQRPGLAGRKLGSRGEHSGGSEERKRKKHLWGPRARDRPETTGQGDPRDWEEVSRAVAWASRWVEAWASSSG